MGERSYAYTKACGIIGKSFIGKRIRKLEQLSRLSELDRMVFPGSSRDLPEKELLIDLEERIISRAVNSIISIVNCFSSPPEFISLLIRSYEYEDLKSAIFSSLEKEKTKPAYTDLGRFQTVRFDAWPDIQGMIKGTEFAFLLERKDILEQGDIAFQTLLDRHYYNALWKSLLALPQNDRRITERILSDEISLKNSCWALRLRTYYRMSPEETKSQLINITLKATKHRSLADEAIRCLDFPLDDFSAWASWRWKDFLNPDSERHWQANPRYFQNAASRYLYRLAKRNFHLNPFSLDSIFCFIKLKQFEEDILTSSIEGLNMGMSSKDIFSMLGVES